MVIYLIEMFILFVVMNLGFVFVLFFNPFKWSGGRRTSDIRRRWLKYGVVAGLVGYALSFYYWLFRGEYSIYGTAGPIVAFALAVILARRWLWPAKD